MRRERQRGALPLRFYRPSKVAEVFGVDPVTVWRWYAKDGVLPPPRRVGGIRGWWEDEIYAAADRIRQRSSQVCALAEGRIR
jgi:predicted DNA-binding transcriptional regulator AlpA